MAYLYIATSQKPTSVTASVECNFTGPFDQNLIVARGNNLEIQTLRADGLFLEKSISLFGRVACIESYRLNGASQDLLFILTQKKHYCVLGWDSASSSPIVRIAGNLKDRFGKDCEMGYRVFIDPDNRMIGILIHEGQLKIFPMDNGALRDPFDVRLDVLRPLDIKFLAGFSRPTICVLYEDNRKTRYVRTFHVDVRDRELSNGPWNQFIAEKGSRLLIPMTSNIGGVVIVSETTITYTNGAKNVQSVVIEYTQICAYGKVDAIGSRHLLGDHKGNLYILVLIIQGNTVTSIAVDNLGATSIPLTLNHLENGVVFVGSCYGDSQLIKLNSDPNSFGSYVETLQTYTNIGPIVDMTIISGDRQGQSHVVTCSGGYLNGSLCIIRSGIGIHEQASMELQGLKGVWSLRQNESEVFDKFLVQSYIGETRVLAIQDEELGEVENTSDFMTNQQTLYCGNVLGGLIVQVTSTRVILIETITWKSVFEYEVPAAIVLASGNLHQLVLALSGGILIYLEVDTSSNTLVWKASVELDHDVACLSLRPIDVVPSDTSNMIIEDSSSSSITPGISHILTVGMWTDSTVRFLALPSLQEMHRIQLVNEMQIRDVLMVKLGKFIYLLLGMGDGALIFYQLDQGDDGSLALSNRRKVVLGTHPVTLSCFYSNAALCVFAACDSPTVIYNNNDKVLFSVVNIHEVVSMTSFHSELFPESLCLVSEDKFMIGNIDSIQKVHIQKIPLDSVPRRISHNETAGILAVCLEKTISQQHGEETNYFIGSFDDSTLLNVDMYQLDVLEQALSCTSCVFEDLPGKEFIVVGTAYMVAQEIEPSKGRILVFEILEDKKLSLLTERETKAAVFTLAPLNGKLVAGVGSKVFVYKIVVKDEEGVVMSGQPTLHQDCGHHGHILALYLKTHGDFILVGDLLRSMTLLRFKSEDGLLEEVARDFNSNFMRSIEILGDGDDYFLGTDDSGNIFTMKRRLDAATEEERAKLESQGDIHLGDYINTIRQGSLTKQPDADLVKASSESSPASASQQSLINAVTGTPSQSSSYLFGTITGSIGTILTLSEDVYNFFAALERSVKSVSSGFAGLSHADWRSFANERRSTPQKNIVDGDLVESFLDFNRETQELIVKQLNDDINAMRTPIAPVTASSYSTGTGTSVSSLSSALKSEEKVISYEDVLQRIEDIVRLH